MSKKRIDTAELLKVLYVELDAVEGAIDRAVWVEETRHLRQREAALLGQIKKLEREHATRP